MRFLPFLLIAGGLLLLSLAGTVSAENETISISVNVPMKGDYPDETKITDSQVNWMSMDIAVGENFTFTFIADNLVNGTEYAFSYEIGSNLHLSGDPFLDNASHLFIANNTEEYSYNLGGQFPATGWDGIAKKEYGDCSKIQVKVSFVKNPNSDNGTQKELAAYWTDYFRTSGYKDEICNPPFDDLGFGAPLLPSVFVIPALISIGFLAIYLYRRK